MLPAPRQFPFGDLELPAAKLATKQFAAFIVEPLQSEAGIRVPDPDIWRKRSACAGVTEPCSCSTKCRPACSAPASSWRGNTSAWSRTWSILAKALCGGLIPCGAVLMSEEIYDSVYDSLKRSIVHTSTFSEN